MINLWEQNQQVAGILPCGLFFTNFHYFHTFFIALHITTKPFLGAKHSAHRCVQVMLDEPAHACYRLGFKNNSLYFSPDTSTLG